jgi:hypothetical protein
MQDVLARVRHASVIVMPQSEAQNVTVERKVLDNVLDGKGGDSREQLHYRGPSWDLQASIGVSVVSKGDSWCCRWQSDAISHN